MVGMNTDQVNSHKLLLHLSDIHFRVPHCLNLDTDQDHPVRIALLNDIRDMTERLGPVDSILITGDIAFKGHRDEYITATEWLLETADVAGCPQTAIYPVPGNHDVNRNTASGRFVQGIRQTILKLDPGPNRDEEIYQALNEERSGTELLTPMEEYNLFAAPFSCDINPGMPFWTKNLKLAPGWDLRIHGLTTTFFSGPDDNDRNRLYLGALQRVFAPSDGIVRLAMMHHPPDWLGDQDEFDDALWDGCAIHLLGHKHRPRYLPSDYGIRLAAGAVNPSRLDRNWEPGYNFIKIQINHYDNQYFLQTDSYLRIWQDSPNRFVPKLNDDGQDVFESKIRLRNKPSHNTTGKAVAKFSSESSPGGLVMNQERSLITKGDEEVLIDTVENSETTSIQRDTVFKFFWELSPSQRRKIMQNLGLLEQADDQLHETLRYRRAFKRARDRNVINKLKEAIDQMCDPTGS